MTQPNDQEQAPETPESSTTSDVPESSETKPGASSQAQPASTRPTGTMTSGGGGGWWRMGLLIAAFVVVTLLVAAWMSSRDRPSASTTTAQAAGAADFDIDKARLETQDLQVRATEAIGRNQDTSELIPKVQALAERYPQFAPIYPLLSQLYLQEGQPKKAYDALNKGLSLDNQQPGVHELAGTLAMAQGEYEKAARHFKLAVGMKPSNVKYRVFLAQCYIQLHQDDKARLTLLAALKINSASHRAYYALSTLDARQGKLDLAITKATRAIDHLPGDTNQAKNDRVAYTRWLAQLLRRDNRPADALRVLEKLPDDQRFSASVIEDMAIAWEMLGQPAKGAALYETALGQYPTHWHLAWGAARWYLKAGDKANAQRMADAIRRINPSTPALKDLTEKIQAAPSRPGK